MGQTAADLSLSPQRGQRALFGYAVRPEDLRGYPREEPPVPCFEDLVALAAAEVSDRDQIVVDLVVCAEAPARARLVRVNPRPSWSSHGCYGRVHPVVLRGRTPVPRSAGVLTRP